MKNILSVVIPLYNKESTVEVCLSAVLNQTLSPDEIIIIDDGSTDNSVTAVEKYLDHFNEKDIACKIIKKANGGVSSARNRGIKEALEGSIICFLDADDTWHPSFLEAIDKAARQYGQYQIYATGYNIRYADGSFKKVSACKEEAIAIINYNDLFEVGELPYFPSCVCIRKSTFSEDCLYFPEDQHIGEDLSCFFLLGILHDTVYVNKQLVDYNVDTPGNTATTGKPMDTPYALKILKNKSVFISTELTKRDNDCHDRFLLLFLINCWKDGNALALKQWCNAWKEKNVRKSIYVIMFYTIGMLPSPIIKKMAEVIKGLKNL